MPMARRASDKASVLLRVTRRGLEPVTPYDGELLSRYPVESDVEATLTQPKSEGQFRLFWVVLGRVLECTDYLSTEDLATALKVRLRKVEAVTLIGGGMHVIPRSFRDFERQEFAEFFDAAMDVLASEVVPGLDIELLIREGRVALREAA